VRKSKKEIAGKHVAEWRGGGGSQSVIWGLHPETGKNYQIVVEAPIIGISFHDIHWPPDWQMSFTEKVVGANQDAAAPATPSAAQLDALPAELIDRITRFMQGAVPAKSGQGGHNRTFAIACTLVNEYALSEPEPQDRSERWQSFSLCLKWLLPGRRSFQGSRAPGGFE
jgi:hypothetical protein